MKSAITQQQHSKIVILADGKKPSHPIPLHILKNAEKIICCDGAISFLELQNMNPHIIIGDCDSITPVQREKFRPIIYEDKNIEYNDLQKAIKYCMANKWNEIVILGAAGCREDHFLANIGILMHYATEISISLFTNYGVFIPIYQTTKFESYKGQQVSVFSFSPETKITYRGLKYAVCKQNFKELWEGSLNESITDSFTIEIEEAGAILVYISF
jgi:thiamine pyrophosphokinase